MVALGVFLLVVGLCDLLRAARDATSTRRRLLIAGIGLALLVLGGQAVGMDGSEWAGLGLGWAIAFLLWLLGSTAALTGGGTPARVVAFTGLGVGLVVSVLGGGVVGLDPGLPAALDGTLLAPLRAELVVLVLGVAASQLSTANVVVRLVLDAVGVPAATGEKQLKGGRLLGPMERLLILGLGIAGGLTAAAVVVAAKGLLRFPELQRGAAAPGPSDVTEYFLIGSFASWLLALGGVGVVALAGLAGPGPILTVPGVPF